VAAGGSKYSFKENTLGNQLTMLSKILSNAKTYAKQVSDFDAGFKIKSVTETNGKPLPYLINNTMMRVDLPQPLVQDKNIRLGERGHTILWTGVFLDNEVEWSFFPKMVTMFIPSLNSSRACVCTMITRVGRTNNFWEPGEFTLPFGDYKVKITTPADHIVGATGILQNPNDVLSKTQLERFEKAKSTFDKPVIIATQAEALEKEKTKSTAKKTWEFHAENVRDFAFTSSRKFIWDAQTVKLGNKSTLAMSFYPRKESAVGKGVYESRQKYIGSLFTLYHRLSSILLLSRFTRQALVWSTP
jgi:hypothetical protein